MQTDEQKKKNTLNAYKKGVRVRGRAYLEECLEGAFLFAGVNGGKRLREIVHILGIDLQKIRLQEKRNINWNWRSWYIHKKNGTCAP